MQALVLSLLTLMVPGIPSPTPTTQPGGVSPSRVVLRASKLEVANMIGVYGGTSPLKATLKRRDTGEPVAHATVTFSVDGAEVGSATTGVNGEARVDLAVDTHYSVGTHTIEAAVRGSPETPAVKASATLAVLQTGTLTSGRAGLNPGDVSFANGADFTYSGVLTRITDMKGIEGRAVIVLKDGVAYKTTATSANGSFAVDFNLPNTAIGHVFTLSAQFDGDARYTGSAAPSVKVTVRPPILGTVKLSTEVSSLLGQPRVGMPFFASCVVKGGGQVAKEPVAGVAVRLKLTGTSSAGKTNADGRITAVDVPQRGGTHYISCWLEDDRYEDGTVSPFN